MPIISNRADLALTPERKVVLELIETALESVQPDNAFGSSITREGNILRIEKNEFNLDNFEHVYILGFGKGAAGNAKLLENLIEDKLTEGFVIDATGTEFKKIEFTQGSHPLPSEANLKFTEMIMDKFSRLTEKDLVLVVICGGGSAMLVHPHSISLEQKIVVEKALLKSGATISEMNTVRKCLSDVKGGGLAQIMYPAIVATLIYSDVPGNDLSVIASGPTTKETTGIEDAINVIKKYKLENELKLPREAFVENPTDDKYFEKVKNNIVLSNITALNAMLRKAHDLGIPAEIYSDHFEGVAKISGQKLISVAHENSILLAGGETTVKVNNPEGIGGRNQEVVLGALDFVSDDVVIASVASDGWDNTENAGALGDIVTVMHAKEAGINPKEFLEKNNSFDFFKKTGDAINTGRLPSNVSDIMIVFKK